VYRLQSTDCVFLNKYQKSGGVTIPQYEVTLTRYSSGESQVAYPPQLGAAPGSVHPKNSSNDYSRSHRHRCGIPTVHRERKSPTASLDELE